MKFSCDRNALAETVTAVAQGLPARPRNPSHLGMLVHARASEFLQFTASDGDNTFNKICAAGVSEPGSFIFPRIFPEVVRSLPGETVSVAVEGASASVAGGRSRFTFPVQPGEDYPFPPINVPELGTVNGEQFREALRKVLPAADRDNPVPALTAVMLKTGLDLTLVATDKYSLACADCDLDLADCEYTEKTALLPVRWAERIAKMDGEKITIGWDEGRIGFSSGSLTITVRQADGQFPRQWDMILSLGDDWMILPDGVNSAVKRAALTVGEKGGIYLDFADELAVRSDGMKGGFSESLPLARGQGLGEWDGEVITVKVGHGMLLDALACCDQVSVETGRPLVFRGSNVRWMIQTRREGG